MTKSWAEEYASLKFEAYNAYWKGREKLLFYPAASDDEVAAALKAGEEEDDDGND